MKTLRHSPALLAVLWLMAILPGRAEIRVFTDSLGRTLRGELTAVNGDFVTIKKEDGQSFTVKGSGFSSADVAYFKEHGWKGASAAPAGAPAAPPTAASTSPMRLGVSVYPKKSERSRGNLLYDKLQKTNYKIEIKNNESQRDLPAAHGILLSLAKVLQTPDESQIIGQEEFDTGPVSRLASFVFESQHPVTSSYDSYDAGYGLRYTGYLFVLKDAEGKVLHVSASSETVAKRAEELLKLKIWNHFDKNFRKTQDGHKPSSASN